MGVCNCYMFCCSLFYVHLSIAIILMGKRELVALLNLSSWCLIMVEWLFLSVPWGCLRFVIVIFPDHTHVLFFSIKAYGGNSWFVDIRKLCVKYSLPDPFTVLDCPPSIGQWKSAVHKAVYAYWVDNLKWRASFYSNLEFLCVSGYWPGKKHTLIQNIGCVSDVPRVHTKLKLVTWTYILQVNRVRSNQNEIDATCQICHQAEETLEHFVLDCTVLEAA